MIFLVNQICNLPRRQSNQKNDDRGSEHECAHVCEPVFSNEGIATVPRPQQEKPEANGGKQLERQIECPDFENDEQRTDAILGGVNIVFSFPLTSLNGQIGQGRGTASSAGNERYRSA